MDPRGTIQDCCLHVACVCLKVHVITENVKKKTLKAPNPEEKNPNSGATEARLPPHLPAPAAVRRLLARAVVYRYRLIGSYIRGFEGSYSFMTYKGSKAF